MLFYVLAAVAIIVALLLTWAAGLLAGLSGLGLLIVRAVLLLLGLLIGWLLLRRRSRREVEGGKTPEGTAVDDIVREAERKLAASPRSGAKRLSRLPLLYVLGDANSAKTTGVLKSGLEPELLAGEIYRDKDVVPTSVANIWFTADAAIVEAGSSMRTNPMLWSRLILRTRPVTYRAAFSADAPFRAAVVCISCEQLMQARTTESLQAAATLAGDRLRQLARQLGTHLPTYVLLTKLDRVPGFAEFVRNLSVDEGSQLLGAAPVTVPVSTGFYAEQAAAAISSAYDALVFSLASARLDLLGRESDPARLGEVYEFPREMRKLRNHLTTYLVELVRPSHLNSNPYLRGFYFTGVRALIQQAAAPVALTPRTAAPVDPGATFVFSVQQAGRTVTPEPLASNVTEKIAQWTFLPRFFSLTVLADTDALSGTSKTNHAALFRRVLYGSCAALLLIFLGLLTVSYVNNAALERSIESASASLDSLPLDQGVLASSEQLNLLDRLRADVVQLADYHQHGAPVMYRWGLYRGDVLLGPARRLYFQHFRDLLLNRTQGNLVASFRTLPTMSAPGADYNGPYAALRAYLITTSFPNRATSDLAPVLRKYWENGAAVSDGNQRELAQRQFDFYARTLPVESPFNIPPEAEPVSHARVYLSKFGDVARIYQMMVTAAQKVGPSINFNHDYPHSADTVIEPHIIATAFTKPGFAFMHDALTHPDTYFRGEAWVLGDQAPPSIELASLKKELGDRYEKDYVAQWSGFLRDATVVHYRDLRDAGTKLNVLSGNDSPLLALIHTVSLHTAVADPQISGLFQAPQMLVPGSNAEQYIGANNKSYVDALLKLDVEINKVADAPAGGGDAAAATSITTAASDARMAARENAETFSNDSAGNSKATQALMLEPITSAEALLHGLGSSAVNAAGKSFCSAFSDVFAKAPFNARSGVEASPAEVTQVLQPVTGSLWQFYNANLKSLLTQQGTEYAVVANAPMQVNPAFLVFFNRVAKMSRTFFPSGATSPTLTFTLRNLPTPDIQSTVIKVDAQSLNNEETSKQFTWSSQTAQSASLIANTVPADFHGTWAVFKLFGKAHAQRNGEGYELDFPLEVANTPSSRFARFEVSGAGAEILVPGALTVPHCVAPVAR